MNYKSELLRGGPVIACAGTDYIISVPVRKRVLMKIVIGSAVYYNHCNGVRISDTKLQRFIVPMEVLNKAKKYTVIFSEVISRGAYSCTLGEEQSIDFDFYPVEKTDGINIYHISDTHGIKSAAVNAAKAIGDKLDLLVLNGDISSSSSKENDIFLQYDIAYLITRGEKPCILSRGNHDLRGALAEKLASYLPTVGGKTYYTVTLGSLWIMILDCGEDKLDSHREYSSTVCCHEMRKNETEFIRAVIADKKNEFERAGIKHKLVVSHVPFEYNNTELCRGERPFDIEHEIYGEWCRLIREGIKPELMLCGHFHLTEVWQNGYRDDKNVGVPVIIGGKPENERGRNKKYIGCCVGLNDKNATVTFTDERKRTVNSICIDIKGEGTT